MQNWLKAHWKPTLAIGLAGLAVIWLLFLRKKSSGASALTLPAAATSGGGTAGSQVGGNGPAGGPGPVTNMTLRSFGDLGAYAQNAWDKFINGVPVRAGASGGSSVISILPFGAGVQVLGQSTGPDPWTGLQAIWEQVLLASGQIGYIWIADIQGSTAPAPPSVSPAVGPATTTPPSPPPTPPPPKHPGFRGSGFRGGDVYPPFAGMDARALGTARQARATGLPAAPLGTPMRPKQPTTMDVRRSPRRETAIAEVNRGPQAVPLPQSFSVVIRQTNQEKQNSIFKAPGQL